RINHCKSLCEIHFYQKSENLIFLKIIFTYLVCEINEENHQFQYSVLNVIQVTAEFTLIYTDYLLDDIKTMTHCDCVILTVRNTQLIMNIIKTLKSKK
ncbi:hypothetical protein BDDG_11756, partial [Blastomyces dermatitidis ATCC 18188]